ncbi:hypothetical protein [Paenibacillus sp. TC-CSREp1]
MMQCREVTILFSKAAWFIVSFAPERVKLKQDTMYMNPNGQGGEQHVKT